MNKIRSYLATTFAALLAAFLLTTEAQAQVVVGSGDSYSYLVIEADDFGSEPFVFQWYYDYDSDTPLTTADMLYAIQAANVGFSFTIYGGSYLDAISYIPLTLTLTNTATPPYSPFWAQWVAGGTSGNPLENVPTGSWSAGYGITFRELAPGSWDGFIFNGAYEATPPYDIISAPPSIAPVPEPGTAVLFGLALVAVILARRGAHATASI